MENRWIDEGIWMDDGNQINMTWIYKQQKKDRGVNQLKWFIC